MWQEWRGKPYIRLLGLTNRGYTLRYRCVDKRIDGALSSSCFLFANIISSFLSKIFFGCLSFAADHIRYHQSQIPQLLIWSISNLVNANATRIDRSCINTMILKNRLIVDIQSIARIDDWRQYPKKEPATGRVDWSWKINSSAFGNRKPNGSLDNTTWIGKPMSKWIFLIWKI